jgi:hypothetical protein
MAFSLGRDFENFGTGFSGVVRLLSGNKKATDQVAAITGFCCCWVLLGFQIFNFGNFGDYGNLLLRGPSCPLYC